LQFRRVNATVDHAMRPLVAVRRATPYDPHFLARHSLLWPLSRAARALAGYDGFPPVEALGGVFDADPPVRFVSAAPRRRRRTPIEARALYDARIAMDGQVPTRAGCWHDLMNALVWGTFPRAKRALHARQHRAIAERLVPGARSLPAVRTPELDALALLDEGGVILISREGKGPEGVSARAAVIFGHAVYESLVLGVAPAVVAAISLPLAGALFASPGCGAVSSGQKGPGALPSFDHAPAEPGTCRPGFDHAPAEPGTCRLDNGADIVRAVDGALAATIADDAMLQTPRAFSRAALDPFAP
jgi:Protein of unknown function (DUF3025)